MRLLVFNCHEAWVHQLGALDAQLDILVGLPGHHAPGWDSRMRPQPARSRLLDLDQLLREAAEGAAPYDCILCHNPTDLMDCRPLVGPRLLLVHSSYEGRIAGERSQVPADALRARLKHYLALIGGHAVAVSAMKQAPDPEADPNAGPNADPGGQGLFPNQVVEASVDPSVYRPHSGSMAAGIRIANQIDSKRLVLAWDFHEAAFAGLPLTLVGHNPGWEGVAPARDWDHLKALLARHRFYVHTADPRYEDGFNMALLEAMAAGLPVLGNRHPSSPIEDGREGFLSDDPAELRARAEQLLADPDLARSLGAAARQKVAGRFPLARFAKGLETAIATAQANWLARQATTVRTDAA